VRAGEAGEYPPHLRGREGDGDAARAAGALELPEPGELHIRHFAVEEEESGEGLV